MTDMDKWQHKDVWRRYGKNFMVEVSRHSVQLRDDHSGCFDSEGPNRWCVYAYIYPKHVHFLNFDGTEAMLQSAATTLRLHGGPSLCRKHVDASGNTTSYQVGADYNHLHDWRYTQYETAKEASAVFKDADDLFDQLTSWDE